MHSKVILYLFIVFFVLIDIYVFQALKVAIDVHNPLWRYLLWGIYWLIALAGWVGIYFLPRIFDPAAGTRKLVLVTVLLGLFIGKLLVVCFLLIDDLRRGGTWLYSLFQKKTPNEGN